MAILSPSTLGLPPHLHSWTQSPEGCCALVLLLDQFPRNAFRGTAATQLRILVLSCFPFCSVSWVAWFTHDFLISLPGPWDKIFDRYIYIYIYIYGLPPPMIHLQAFYMGITSVLCTFFFTRKMTFSCFYFFYLLRKLPTQTHTHMQFCFCLLFCHFLRFWSKTKKHWENQKKQKKQNCKTHVGTSWWVRVCNFVFFVFLDFSRFLILLVKNPKNIEKTKKNKIARPM